MSDDFEETTIPYKEIIRILKDHEWDGYLLSEYEGADKFDFGYEVGQTLRKQHIMLKNGIGEQSADKKFTSEKCLGIL